MKRILISFSTFAFWTAMENRKWPGAKKQGNILVVEMTAQSLGMLELKKYCYYFLYIECFCDSVNIQCI
jgi:hypothetical protein